MRHADLDSPHGSTVLVRLFVRRGGARVRFLRALRVELLQRQGAPRNRLARVLSQGYATSGEAVQAAGAGLKMPFI